MLWDTRRPFIPFASFTEHSDDVTGIYLTLIVMLERFSPNQKFSYVECNVYMYGAMTSTKTGAVT